MVTIDRLRLAQLIGRERETYAARHPRSRHAFGEAAGHLLGGVPMTWMRMWAGGFPLYLDRAHGARLTDLDGHEFIDFCLGDTGAMAGHSPAAVQEAVSRRYCELGGATTMLPTQDAEWVAAELTRRFGPTQWSFTLTATDANRWAIRLARQLTGRPKILVFSTRAWNLDPDVVTIGKSIAGGIPAGAYGLAGPLAERIMNDDAADIIDTGGVGGTLAGNALSVAATRATLNRC